MPYRRVTYLEQIWYLIKFKIVKQRNPYPTGRGGESMAKCKSKGCGKGKRGC